MSPDLLSWSDDGLAIPLFGELASHAPGADLPIAVPTTVPRAFLSIASSVACHREMNRWSFLYSCLWRLAHGEPHLLEVAADPLTHRLLRMHKEVRRASHKMKAFVRFREVNSSVGSEPEYVAWFEPAHRVVERTAPFFADRFPSMRWSILTPDGCARFDGSDLTLTEGIERRQVPHSDDALEDLWRRYYAGIFNPARLNRSAMRAEMPMRYWKNLPESRLIESLSRDAPSRVARMIAQTTARPEELPRDLDAIESPSSQPGRFTSSDSIAEAPHVPWHSVCDPGWQEARRRGDDIPTPRHPLFARRGCDVYAGVAGWTDPSLLAPDVFYPSGAKDAESRLRYYATLFPMVEVDATYYAFPSVATSQRWVDRTPHDFVFDVKAHSLMTGHPTDPSRLPEWLRSELPVRLRGARNVYSHHFSSSTLDEIWRRFIGALEPLRAAHKLGAVMLQYPRWFTPTKEHADELKLARERLGSCPASVELRHRDWMSGRLTSPTFDLLRNLEFSYVAVDAPPGMESSMPPTVEVTHTDLAIFRFHGRRETTWETRNDSVIERYRYLYTKEQLVEWIPSIERAINESRRVHLTFNNNYWNYATTNAREMRNLFLSL